VLILIGLSYGRRKPAFAYSIVVWPLVALILYALQTTGARGGLIALGSGLLFFSLGGEGVATRVRNIGVVLLAITFCIWMALQSETMAQRFEKSFDEGSMAQRENLYPAAWKMVVDRPLLGWGPTLNMWELGSRVGEPDHPFRDTHDLLLEILTVSGVFGAIPFFAGVFLCLHSSWRGQKGAEGVLPLATTVAILVSNVGANLLYNKVYWLLIAYALASKDQWSDKNQPERSFPAALIRDRQLKNVLT
jgi:O-antigen ligase